MELDNNRKIEIIIGLFLLGGIITWLVIPMSFQDTTIILEGGNGGAPISCLPNGGFILAQNLTDLCDVTIDTPLTSQIIEYNGSQWINVNNTDTITSITSNNNNTIGIVPTTGNVILYPKYELLCQTILINANSTVSCNGFPAREHIFVRTNIIINNSGIAPVIGIQFNGDTGANYAWRRSSNGGADTTAVSTNQCSPRGTGTTPIGGGLENHFELINILSYRKVLDGTGASGIDTSSATNTSRDNFACKWDNTSMQITSITLMRSSGTAVYGIDTSLTVWGYN